MTMSTLDDLERLARAEGEDVDGYLLKRGYCRLTSLRDARRAAHDMVSILGRIVLDEYKPTLDEVTEAAEAFNFHCRREGW